MLRKHVAKFGGQWDRFLPGVLWAYRNTPHEPTKEKPSFLLFTIDLRSPTEAALLPPDPISPCDGDDYREELMVSLSSARELAVASIREAQWRYKGQYDKGARVNNYRVGDWVFVKFPAEESGKNWKMSRPWCGPFRILERRDPNLIMRSVSFPEEPSMLVHQLRVCPCPNHLPEGFFWYGSRRRSPGQTPAWLDRCLNSSGKEPAEGTGGGQEPLEETTAATHIDLRAESPVDSDGEVQQNLHNNKDGAIDDENEVMTDSTKADNTRKNQDGGQSSQIPAFTNARQKQVPMVAIRPPIPAVAPSTGRYNLRDHEKHQRSRQVLRVTGTSSSGRTEQKEGVM